MNKEQSRPEFRNGNNHSIATGTNGMDAQIILLEG